MYATSLSYDRHRFNGLPEIEAADSFVRSSGSRARVLRRLSPIFFKHQVCDWFGLCLLHKHWQLEDDELPLQEITATNSRLTLTTTPQHRHSAAPVWPSVFQVSGACGLQALEFSTDHRVGVANSILEERPAFGLDFCEAIAEEAVADCFGLCVIRPQTKAGLQFVEFNYAERVSITREITSLELGNKIPIQTQWRFHADAMANSCEASCFSQCIVSGDGSHRHAHPKAHKPG